jgi:hypothetical protein
LAQASEALSRALARAEAAETQLRAQEAKHSAAIVRMSREREIASQFVPQTDCKSTSTQTDEQVHAPTESGPGAAQERNSSQEREQLVAQCARERERAEKELKRLTQKYARHETQLRDQIRELESEVHILRSRAEAHAKSRTDSHGTTTSPAPPSEREPSANLPSPTTLMRRLAQVRLALAVI